MTTRPAPPHDASRPPARQGLVARTVHRIGTAIRWLFLSLLVSILIEWLGMVFWWPAAGLQHSRQMFTQEMEYLHHDFRRSVVSSDPARFASTIAERSHYVLFELTGVTRLTDWLSVPPKTADQELQRKLHQWYLHITVYVAAAMHVVQVFSVRLAVLCLAMPLFLLFSLIGVVDGLVQRDLRRWGGGRESSYLYHYAKNSVWLFVLTAWVIYLALPFSVHPVLIVLPFSILFGISISITASTFKKYL